MIPMTIILDGDGAWPDLQEKQAAGTVVRANINAAAALAMGTERGRPSVMFRVDLPDGRTVLAETTLALLAATARAFIARHGDPAEWAD